MKDSLVSHVDPITQRELELQDQFRLDHMQLHNWGTFNGMHTIKFARKGHLIVGKSGSGKSTILDAKTALLAPTSWGDFNAAAREQNKREKDRDLMTYVRGAWRKVEGDDGRTRPEMLRKSTTWSAIAMQFSTETGRVVTLAQVFWVRGADMDNSKVHRHFIVMERAFDLMELEFFEKVDLNLRKLKEFLEAEGAAYNRDIASGYRECLMNKLDIPTEQALKLLHKAQSIKNVSSITDFMRELMLEVPSTFDDADTLVKQFTNLEEAHNAVLKAREQIQTLIPAREAYEDRRKVLDGISRLKELEAVLSSYTALRKDSLLAEAIQISLVEQRRLEDIAKTEETKLNQAQVILETLKKTREEKGGAAIEQLKGAISTWNNTLEQRTSKLSKVKTAILQFCDGIPSHPDNYAEVQAKAKVRKAELERDDEAIARRHAELYGIATAKFEEIKKLKADIQEMEGKESNIDPPLRSLRINMSTAIGCAPDDLPFAGELLEVCADEQQWRGALERLLGGFATSMLVPEKLYPAILQFVDEHNLRRNFFYHRVSPATVAQRREIKSTRSAALKLNVRNGPFTDWIDAELESRFNHECVDNRDEMARFPYSITKMGQIRNGKSKHEKFDGRPLNDPNEWNLGWNNADKIRAMRNRLTRLEKEWAEAQQNLSAELARAKSGRNEISSADQILVTEWIEIDVLTCQEQLFAYQSKLDMLRNDNLELNEIERQITAQTERLDATNIKASDARANLRGEVAKFEGYRTQLNQLREDPTIFDLSPQQTADLDQRFTALEPRLTLSNLKEVEKDVKYGIGQDTSNGDREAQEHKQKIERAFRDFKQKPAWAPEVADLDDSIDSAGGFFSLLDQLERDRLPDFVERFKDLLQKQGDENLATLSSNLFGAATDIETRLDEVNAALSEAPFGNGAFLKIQSRSINQTPVVEFKQILKQALSQTFRKSGDDDESRFMLMKQLVDRLKDTTSEDERWRKLVLDVRQHVEFIARAKYDDGSPDEVFDGGGGKSGGQRQKLTTTCVAAALRFQLVRPGRLVPSFSLVMMDEAYDKADHEFTTMVVNIYNSFGFQNVVANPFKAVTPYEPFIGGGTIVTNPSERKSSAHFFTVKELMQKVMGESADA